MACSAAPGGTLSTLKGFMSIYHIAQVNIAEMRAPLDSETMTGFVARLDEINALAERTPGFVWRLKGDANNATALRIFDNHSIIINMSVWDSIDALYQYTYYSDHAQVYRQRGEWFRRLQNHMLALWWVPAGHTPTPQEAKDKLAYLNAHGATPLAFNFKQRYSVEEMISAINT